MTTYSLYLSRYIVDNEKNQDNQQPEQNELDLEFNQVEPITPKKSNVTKPSLFDKVKAVVTNFSAKKDQPSRQEPQLSQDNLDVVPEQSNSASDNFENSEKQTINTDGADEQNQTNTKKFDWKHPENWALLQKLPQRHRRIVIVLLVLIILLLLFLWLKPSSTTVDAIHQQNQNNLPIEFQPLDQSLAVVDEQLPSQTDTVTMSEPNAPLATTVATNIASGVELPVVEPEIPTVTEPAQVEATPAPASTPTRPISNRSQTQQPKATAPARQETARTNNTRTTNNQPAHTKNQSATKATAPVVDAKPATTTNSARANSKTLTISKGVSLMQVFRDNNLNISDVNAMTKANGAGNILSSFKPGDKVQVSVQTNGRVSELRLQDGSRFIRQADGSYIYRK